MNKTEIEEKRQEFFNKAKDFKLTVKHPFSSKITVGDDYIEDLWQWHLKELEELEKKVVSRIAENQYKIFEEADKQMKKSNGHYYVHMLKTRCVYCNKSEKNTKKCGSWFQTFLKRIEEIYLNSSNYPEIFNKD